MNNKPQFNYEKALSWSAMSCFSDDQWGDKEKWYQSYVMGIKEKPSRELIFGSKVDNLIQDDPTFLPELERYPVQQYKVTAEYKGIPLVGIFDQWDPYGDRKRLADDKTGKNPWTKKKADETGQLTMYATLLYLTEGIKPEDIDFGIRWLPTVQNADLSITFAKPFEIKYFNTKRKTSDVLKMLKRIENVWEAMIKYTEGHK
jgi:hypothetical protein